MIHSAGSPLAALMLAGTLLATPAPPALAAPPDELSAIVVRLGRVASLYRDTALRFACDEAIYWQGSDIEEGRESFAYVFTFSEENGFEDYRTHRGLHANRANPRKLYSAAPFYLGNAFLFAFAFREERRPYHDYRIVGEGTVLDRPAIGVAFEPRGEIVNDINDLYGVAWVDRNTSQLLRVEAFEPESHMAQQQLEKLLAGAGSVQRDFEIQRIVTDFTIEKHGLRFPGRVVTTLESHNVRGSKKQLKLRRHTRIKVVQTYDDYEFYSVRTAEEIRRVVDGEPGASPP